MTSHVNRTPLYRLFAIMFLLVVSAPVWAQSIIPHSTDISGNIGFSTLDGIDGDKHVNFGFSGGVNLSDRTAILGEYTYMPMGSTSAYGVSVSGKNQLLGAAYRVSFPTSSHVLPYVIVGGGYARVTASGSESGITASASMNGEYIGFGGGATVFAGHGWGLRPEVRWDRLEYSYSGERTGQSMLIATVSAFYQWGGRAKR